jgi:hypothetical protein
VGTTGDILTEAHGLVRGERLEHYGPPTENFRRIADLWTAYLGPSLNAPLNEQDVCAMMIFVKQARIKTGGGYHRDSAVDTAGYAALQEILHAATHGESADAWIRGALSEEPTGVHVAVPDEVLPEIQYRSSAGEPPTRRDPDSDGIPGHGGGL